MPVTPGLNTAWMLRRARRLQQAFGLSHREALKAAAQDWQDWVGRSAASSLLAGLLAQVMESYVSQNA